MKFQKLVYIVCGRYLRYLPPLNYGLGLTIRLRFQVGFNISDAMHLYFPPSMPAGSPLAFG